MDVGNKNCPKRGENTVGIFYRSEQESNDDANESNTVRASTLIYHYSLNQSARAGKLARGKKKGTK